MTTITMEHLVNLAKNRGFVYQGSEIYGGLANAWDYGPYGTIMKENIKFLWQREFIQKRTNMVGLDSAILMNPQVWVASGHVGGFSDPLVDCKSCKTRHRADKLLEEKYWEDLFTVLKKEYCQLIVDELSKKIEEVFPEKNKAKQIIDSKLWELEKKWWVIWKINYTLTSNLVFDTLTKLTPRAENAIEILSQEIDKYISMETNQMIGDFMKKNKILCPDCWECNWTDIREFNLMFRTSQGVTEDSSATIYMRPETAQGIFVNFANIVRTSRKKIPFGVAQVGKAFRNEITPGNFIFRTREFEQMEIEYFVEPGKDLEAHAEWKQMCWDFLLTKIGLKEDSLRMRDHDDDELSHYSNATTDIEFRFPFGWGELWGIADRTDFDLKAHMKESKQDLSYFDPVNNKKYIPYVIEPSVGLTRLFLATLADAYTVEEERSYLKLDPKVAPIKVGVLPVVKKLSEEGKAVYAQLSEDFFCEYDDTWSVGKRYARMDEIGTPFCVTIDSENYDAGNVTVRHRDSMKQEIVALSELNHYIKERLK